MSKWKKIAKGVAYGALAVAVVSGAAVFAAATLGVATPVMAGVAVGVAIAAEGAGITSMAKSFQSFKEAFSEDKGEISPPKLEQKPQVRLEREEMQKYRADSPELAGAKKDQQEFNKRGDDFMDHILGEERGYTEQQNQHKHNVQQPVAHKSTNMIYGQLLPEQNQKPLRHHHGKIPDIVYDKLSADKKGKQAASQTQSNSLVNKMRKALAKPSRANGNSAKPKSSGSLSYNKPRGGGGRQF